VKLSYRQIHLDFHTSPLIQPIASDFDPQTFAETLTDACVESVTCFAKCHHGMFYYPSRVGPMHPGLERDLLGEMIESCHSSEIRVPAYISVQFDEHAAKAHPQWRAVDPDGRLPGPLVGDAPGVSWPTLCWCTGYRDYLRANVIELLDNYDVDGVFFDICIDQISCSEAALAKMRADNLDPDSDADRKLFAHQEAVRFVREFSRLVHRHRRGLPVFFNGRVELPMRDSLSSLTHIEVESLPTGGWGYDHFQRMGRYVRRLGKPFLGMTARFHKSWADFGTLKRPAALRYEALTSIAFGGGVSIGDQLHPRGALDPAVYRRIKPVFEEIRDLEPWCVNAEPVAQIGMLSALTNTQLDKDRAMAIDRGATAALNQTHHLFDLLDTDSALDPYELVILPDAIAPTKELIASLQQYLKQGGSLLDEQNARFALKNMPATYQGRLEHQPFYFTPAGAGKDYLEQMPHCMYEAGLKVRKARGTTTLARVVTSYFNRSAAHYCSHFQTPADRQTTFPACVASESISYINAPVFRAYAEHGNESYRQLIQACVDHLLPEPVIRTSLPPSAHVSVLDQKRLRRRIVHLLHFPPSFRAGGLDIIESGMCMCDIAIDLAVAGQVKRVELIPSRDPLPFEQIDDRVRCILPKAVGHAAICVTTD
jgi:hypothetical protein